MIIYNFFVASLKQFCLVMFQQNQILLLRSTPILKILNILLIQMINFWELLSRLKPKIIFLKNIFLVLANWLDLYQ